MVSKKKKSGSQAIRAGIEPVGKNRNYEKIYELREWTGSKIHARGTIHVVFDRADALWPGHVRRQNGGPDKYLVLEPER